MSKSEMLSRAEDAQTEGAVALVDMRKALLAALRFAEEFHELRTEAGQLLGRAGAVTSENRLAHVKKAVRDVESAIKTFLEVVE